MIVKVNSIVINTLLLSHEERCRRAVRQISCLVAVMLNASWVKCMTPESSTVRSANSHVHGRRLFKC